MPETTTTLPVETKINDAIEHYLKQNRPRAGSFIVTLFGDVISQHGNCVWLGAIIESVEAFGLNARQVRTAVGRLVQDRWLQSQQIGRKSYYSFTEHGQRQFKRVAGRIYARQLPDWDQQWTLVLLAQAEPRLRDSLRRELAWLGFGQINGYSFAHPRVDKKALAELLADLDAEKKLLVMQATTDEITNQDAVNNIAYQSWQLEEIKPRYEMFCEVFGGILRTLDEVKEKNEQQMFQLRLLMIHEYRRLLLKTTELPHELLPKVWPGHEALSIASALYGATSEASVSYIEKHFQAINGRVSAVDESFFKRFA